MMSPGLCALELVPVRPNSPASIFANVKCRAHRVRSEQMVVAMRRQVRNLVHTMPVDRHGESRLSIFIKGPVLGNFVRSLEFNHDMMHVSDGGIGQVCGVEKAEVNGVRRIDSVGLEPWLIAGLAIVGQE